MNKLSTLIIIYLISLMSGCAMYEGGNIPSTSLDKTNINIKNKKSLSFTSLAKGGFSKPSKQPEFAQNIIKGELTTVLEKSGYFSRISANDPEAELKLELIITEAGNPAALIPAFITGLSLYTIPSWATSNYEVNAIIQNKEGRQKKYLLKDSVTLVQWLPMIFAFPSHDFSVVPKVRKNMYRYLLKQIKDDGFLDEANPAISLTD
ncbi:hypothetical protein KCM76_14635 [Zooshikella marina]|uniref:hypothetical protein n=1 Tax=Zooshikella ganghwensis TaxID=202772 RepID=UPI000481D8F7|nr:hypothetical protein [Zooshikella ganghwensis]MBU2707229.1 hypothetical protein [Zooshikella ganghwensis]